MHILFLTDNFPPESNAPATRTYEHAVRWVKKGHEVTVITCAPNFPEGKVYKGYKNDFYTISDLDGIKVVRVKTYITSNEGFAKRVLDYISFMFSSFAAGLIQKSPDIIVATSPQFFTACSGWALSAIRRKKFVFELRDIWPASITAVGAMKNSWVIRCLEKIELFLYRRADSIICVTNSFKKELVERGIDKNKIEVVLNGVDLNTYTPRLSKDQKLLETYDLKDKFVLGYIGTHGMAHGLETIVAVAEELQHIDELRFVFAGSGASKQSIVEMVQEKRLENVVFIDRQPKEMMPLIWSLCDVSLVPLVNSKLFETVIPSKIFECMGMGIPTVMSVPLGEATAIIHDTNSGLIAKSEDISSIKKQILKLYEDPELYSSMQMNSIEAAKKFSRDSMADKMIKVFNNL
ncbi:glycosyltransferase WbuB [Vibrio parahaemolyticus]|uniref:Putative teichuronic acid biosynthesis glycosyltransferase TuaH n=2 Tax=Vibrio parahaemolyticus TaxID=670 RepID=A0A7M1VPR0_VIBPH|nr:glycosyltransferase family 4 protein [Vibrio parahaemolyticus]ELE7132582.1 glycosyltransferase family 4 protein [Vibrio harveyi]RFD41220.1 glycosyltransferase WbuB [Vibrio parahaemolyticus 3355]EGR0922715.1 glycosyltransferase WbuB [Vibrio parahaemolyticus]EGR0985295.1 glycosyltransferase WbuB [Vibrio parahaemolyticus]EGR1371742.1 glycosyltransferase WbuB [Vibrio parahaemolyticus]